MERRVQKIKTVLSVLLVFFSFKLFSQVPDFSDKIRILVWSELDAYPGFEEVDDYQFAYPVNRLKQTAPFLINGMVYGWKFEYTPSDKLRNVKEYFNVEEIQKVDFTKNTIHYSSPLVEDNRLKIWVEFERDDPMKWYFNSWNSIKNERIQGRGKARLSEGFDGIVNAANDSLKNAIRQHYTKILKNKPKEIDGRVIIKQAPRIEILNGCYIVELDFFLETDRIIKYTQF